LTSLSCTFSLTPLLLSPLALLRPIASLLALVKEIVEGVFPIVGHLYSVNRQLLAGFAGFASRTLLGSRQSTPPSSSSKSTQSGERGVASGEGRAFRTPETFRKEMKALHPELAGSVPHPASSSLSTTAPSYSLKAFEAPKTPLGSNGLGLVDEPASSPAPVKAVPTTMAEE
jgi:hypothetical protein